MTALPRISFSLLILPFLALTQSPAARAEEDAEDLYKKVVKSAVFIVTPATQGYSMGSGTLVDVEKKIVITNFHVVDNEKFCYCQFPVHLKDGSLMTDKTKYIDRVKQGQAIKAEVLYRDSSRDLAILKLQSVPPGTPALAMSAKGVGQGATVWNIGSPGAVDQVFGITKGDVRTVGFKEYLTGGPGGEGLFSVKAKVVQTTNPTNPGDSGGPLFNKHGEMVGVTQGGSSKANLVSLFIDISEVKTFLDEKKIVIKAKGAGVSANPSKETPKTTEEAKLETKPGTTSPGTTTPPKDVSKDEKDANALLSLAKTYAKDEEQRAKYITKLKDVVAKFPNTAAGKEAKRLLDGLK